MQLGTITPSSSSCMTTGRPAHGVGAGCRRLVPISGSSAGGAGVGWTNAIAVRPTVVSVGDISGAVASGNCLLGACGANCSRGNLKRSKFSSDSNEFGVGQVQFGAEAAVGGRNVCKLFSSQICSFCL